MLTVQETVEGTKTNAEQLVDSFIEVVTRGGNIEQIPEYMHEDVLIQSVTGVNGKGFGASKDAMQIWVNAFDIVNCEYLCSLAADDKVLNQWELKAIHVGDFLGVPPSKKEITFTGVTLYQVNKDKIVGIWGYSDFLNHHGSW